MHWCSDRNTTTSRLICNHMNFKGNSINFCRLSLFIWTQFLNSTPTTSQSPHAEWESILGMWRGGMRLVLTSASLPYNVAEPWPFTELRTIEPLVGANVELLAGHNAISHQTVWVYSNTNLRKNELHAFIWSKNVHILNQGTTQITSQNLQVQNF